MRTSGRVGESGCEAEHLLLAAGEQAGDLAAPVGEDREALVRPGCAGPCRATCTERFSSTVSPGKMPRASGTRRTPSRARRNGAQRRDVVAVQEDLPERRVDEAGRDRAERGLARTVGAEERRDGAGLELQVDAVQDLDVAVAGDDVAQREDASRCGAGRARSGRVDGTVGRARRGGLDAVVELVLRDDTVVDGRLGVGDALVAPPFAFLAPAAFELALAGEGEDAVGFLGELDRAEAGEDGDEVDGRDRAR